MRKMVVALAGLAILITLITLFFAYSDQPITGSVLFGTVNLYVLSDAPIITIHSPINTTYNFAIGSNLTLELNVSSTGSNASAWWYTLEDLFHNSIANNSIIFAPNTTFNAVRKSNRLTVYANNSAGVIGSESVVFYVSVPNSAPLLGNITSNLYTCEASAFSYTFNATDIDEENLFTSVAPTSPFFVFPSTFFGETFVESELFSGILEKGHVGDHLRTLSVSDGQYSDSKNTTIHVIEINNIPEFPEIGVRTAYLQGEDSALQVQASVIDVEDGDWDSGNLSFNISFNGGPQLFNISPTGLMNYTPNVTDLGVHNITVCTADNELPNIPSNISYCNQTGLSNTVCRNFSFTVTDENRPPTIVSYYPSNNLTNATAGQGYRFNITTYDPDYTIPDVYWYYNGHLIQYNQGNTTTWMEYSFPCGISGWAKFKAIISDGLLNDSVNWNISINYAACPTPVTPAAGGGGGGGGGGILCSPQWGCNDWQICQNTETSLELGIIAGEDYRLISESCSAAGRDEGTCGYQTRTCFDNAYCNSTKTRPSLIQSCFYSENPSCSDGIKNCHDGSCELLVDCGGPCTVCASCSDGKQNQGELGTDCGGPCPFQCPAEVPFLKISIWRTIFIWLFWLILLILLIVLTRRIIRLIQIQREMQKVKRIQSVLSK